MRVIVILFSLYGSFHLTDATLRWSKSYTLKAVLTVPAANLSEPYQVWLDADTGRARVDFYDGMDKLYREYDRTAKKYKFFKIYPESSAKWTNREVCSELSPVATETRMIAINSYLPNRNFKFVGVENIRHIDAHKYEYVYDVPLQEGQKEGAKITFSVWVTFRNTSQESIPIPIRYVYELKTSKVVLDYFRHDYLYFNNSAPEPSVLQRPLGQKCNDLTDLSFHEPIDPLAEFIDPFIEDSRVTKAFDRFKRQHNKKYTDENEHFKRMSIFKDNLRFINSFNRQHRSFKVGVNHLADLSAEEKSVFLGTRFTDDDIAELEDDDDDDDDEEGYDNYVSSDNEKMALDWRDFGAVTSVKDQTSQCGSCYAFTTAAAIESSAYIAKGCKNMLELSEQAIIDCTWFVDNEQANFGCNGGRYESALMWIQMHGIPVKQEYGPYLAMEGRCHHRNMTKLLLIRGYNKLSRKKRIIKLALRKTGPLLASLNSSPNSFTYYTGGIYDDPTCSSEPDKRTHGVTIVGFGKEYGQEYWILKNSFGPTWGEGGYMRLATKNNICGIKNFVYNVEFRASKAAKCKSTKIGD